MKEKIKNALRAKFLGQYTNSSNKQRSLIILIVGFSLLIVLLIVAKVNYNNIINSDNNKQNNIDEVKFLSLDKIFNNYIDNYNYYITINDNNSIIKYEGTIKEKINDGKRITSNEEINYNITEDIIIDINTNKEISNFYYNYLSNFFNPTNVYEFIKDKENSEEIVDNKKIYIYNSIYNDGDIMFKITTTKDRIEEINYIYNNINYNIMFD